MKNIDTLLTRALGFVLAMFLLAIATIVVTLVVLRYLFNSSITGANEIITVLFVYTTAIGSAVAVGKGEHIAIRIAVERLPDHLQKIPHAMDLLLVALINGIALGYGVVWIRATGSFLMPSTGLPRIVAQLSIPVGCGLAVLYCGLQLLFALTGRQEPGRAWMRDEPDGDGIHDR